MSKPTRQSLLDFYHENKHLMVGRSINKKEFKSFRNDVKSLYSFIDEMTGRKEFSVYLHCLLSDINEPPSCVVCGDRIKTAHTKEFPKTCSRRCNGAYTAQRTLETTGTYSVTAPSSIEKAKETTRLRYGTTHYMQSAAGRENHRKSLTSKYGVENVFQLDATKEKIKNTNIAHRGVDNPMKSDEIRQEVKKTNQSRYGVDNPMKSDAIKEKSRRTCLDRYGVEYYSQTDNFRSKRPARLPDEIIRLLDDRDWLEENHKKLTAIGVADKLGVDGTTVKRYMDKHGIHPHSTGVGNRLESEIYDFVHSLGVDALQSNRTILQGREIDILVPGKRIGIEFNGLYWHSSKFTDNRYHLNKTEQANRAGYQLIHIFEDEWVNRQDAVKMMIASKLGKDQRPVVYARKTTVVENPEGVRGFLNTNHIQGNTGHSVCFGLIDEGSLVAVMTFRKSGDEEYELNRFATSKRVPGGFSKLFSASIVRLRELGCRRVVSFADRRYSTGGVYTTNGWTHEYDTPPDYQYVIGNTRVRKQNYRRKYLPDKLDVFDPSLSETKNMENNGYYRIYDCGLMKFSIDI